MKRKLSRHTYYLIEKLNSDDKEVRENAAHDLGE